MLAACSAPVASDELAIHVPEGTREVEHAAVAVAERTEQLAVERELVVGGAFDAPFYRLRDIAIAESGDLFVLDAGNHRVVVTDADGNALRQFGRAGQGPGELQNPDALAIVGDRVAVWQGRQRRMNLFDLEGAHVEDHVLVRNLEVGEMTGLDDALVVANRHFTPVPIQLGRAPTPAPWGVATFALDGTLLAQIVATHDVARARYRTQNYTGLFPIAVPQPRAALAPDGLVYASASDEYEIVALDSSGNSRWVLRVGWTSEGVTDARKDEISRHVLDGLSGETFVDTAWIDRFPAIVNLEVDGHGNLYAFPYDPDTYFDAHLETRDPARPVPVDVYAPDGQRLFAGLTGVPSWDAQHDDRVCRLELDPASEEGVVACYRMISSPGG
jgi:hypothetical protein